jgi:hypothetical protein
VAFAGCLAAGLLGGVSWPNSGDEYSYVFLADTFLAGRLYDPAPPDPVLFEMFHVLVKDGRTFSPYPPAWSAYLVPFRAVGAVWLANPLLTVFIGTALAGSMGRLGISPAVRNPALALVLLTPFTLFLGGSVFPQTMACALIAGIVWAQLADEAGPRAWRKLLIGGLFGVLLLTRYDIFAIVALLYAIDRIISRRLGAVADGLLIVLGLLPFVACLAAYNAGVTGHPLQSTAFWAPSEIFTSRDAGTGISRVIKALELNAFWVGSLAQFGGLPILVLAAFALPLAMRRRTCRFYDFLLPAAIAFYSCVPFSGGHQYGPRYWFWAWPFAVLTITSVLVDRSGSLIVAGRRVAFDSFAAACLVYAAAAFCVLLLTTHVYMDARREVFGGARPDGKSVILLPSRDLVLWPWQAELPVALTLDFTRNDIDYGGPVLYGRGDVRDAVARACRLGGRAVFRWEGPAHLVPMGCP